MPCDMIVKMKALPGRRDEVVEFFGGLLKETRGFPGCEAVTLYVVEGSEDEIVLVDRWTDRAAFDRYFAWRLETGHIEQLVQMLAEPIESLQLVPTDY